MKPELRKLFWLLPLSVLISFIASLGAIWIVNGFFQTPFNSTSAVVIGMLIAASSGTTISAILLLFPKKNTDSLEK